MNEKNGNEIRDKPVNNGKNEKIFYEVGKHKLKSNRILNIASTILYIIFIILAWFNSWKILVLLHYESPLQLDWIIKKIVNIIGVILVWLLHRGCIVLIGMIGRPADAKETEQTLKDNRFVTGAGDSPLLLSKGKDKTKEDSIDSIDSIEYTFYNRGINIEKWKFIDFENWLDGYITYLDYSKHTKKHTVIRITPTEKYKPFILTTKDNKMTKNPRHTLICGESGSGKSYLTLTLAYQYAREQNTSLFLIDGKNEGYEQFDFLEEEGRTEEKAKNFYSGEHPEEGIRYFYENVFEYKRKNKNDKEFKNITHILILEEYSSILQDLGKQEQEIKKMVSRMLKMGRSLNCFIWTCEQKPMSEYYSNARNNFSQRIIVRTYGKTNRRDAI